MREKSEEKKKKGRKRMKLWEKKRENTVCVPRAEEGCLTSMLSSFWLAV